MFEYNIFLPYCQIKSYLRDIRQDLHIFYISYLNVITPEEISRVCHVPLSCAKARSDRMKLLVSRNNFLTDELETRVFNNFKPYILDALAKRAAEKENEKQDVQTQNS